jgi:hypothetical protein
MTTVVKKFRKNDEGAALELIFKENGVVVDISSATSKLIKLQKPDGTVLTKSGSFATTGTDGKLWYVIEHGILDVIGEWMAEGYVELSGGKKLHTTISRFEVEKILE